MTLWITNARLILPEGIFPGSVLVQGSRIAQVYILGTAPKRVQADKTIDAAGRYLAPGFIDIHTHGAVGRDFTQADEKEFYCICSAHLQHGTTMLVPTTLSSSQQELMDFLAFFNTLQLQPEGLPEIAGLHLEGPYFSYAQRGAQNPAFLRNPLPQEYNAVLDATDRICRWSFAAELPGATEFLRTLVKKGIVASLAHSEATCAQVEQAHAAGLQALTHFYSGMESVKRVNAYRVAGAVEAGYLLDTLYCEVIADGCHLPPELLRLIYKVKGPDHICLVTDSMSAACMPEGEYTLGGLPCVVEKGVAKLKDGSAFAGSVATADRLVRTFWHLTQTPLHECVKMITLTPAKLLGLEHRKGSIAPGKDADLLLFDENVNISYVLVRGKEVLQH